MYRLEVGCDDSKQTKNELITLIGKKPSGRTKVGYRWGFDSLDEVQHARAVVTSRFSTTTPRDVVWAWARAYDPSGAPLFDAAPPSHTPAYRVEVRVGVQVELEPWLTIAVGRTPESAPGCYSWSFADVNEARSAARGLQTTLGGDELPGYLRDVARGCFVRVLAMELVELPAASERRTDAARVVSTW